jgi:hypothetical protein
MEYHPDAIFKNAHINTCFPTLFRKVHVDYWREEIETWDNDFFHVDWIKNNNPSLLILCHGVEGSSHSKYMMGMAKYFSERGWDVAAINSRSCSGVMNRLLTSYHMGCTDDINYFCHLKGKEYKKIAIIGFSMGANLVLNFLANEKNYKENIVAAAAVSPPCHLLSSALKLESFSNYIYTKQFLDSLKKKIYEKSKRFPEKLDYFKIAAAKTLREFDDNYTAPLNGFKNAIQYYERSSSLYVLHQIKIPTFILTPLDDPMMSSESYPVRQCAENPFLTLECPQYGGHVGFSSFHDYPYWHEVRIYKFIEEIIKKGE